MSKFNVSFNVDLSHIAPDLGHGSEVTEGEVSETITKLLLGSARRQATEELHKVRKDACLDNDVKAIRMAEHLRKIMLTLMAEANLKIEAMPEDTAVQTELPFERQYAFG